MVMRKIVLFIMMGLLFLSGYASAYSIMIDAPSSLPVGKPLVVTGNTSLGIGTPMDVVLYLQLTTATEVQRQVVYIQSDRTFRAVFDTTGLQKGTYKVEVPLNGGGDSVTARVVNLVDRSDEITMTSPSTQNFKNTMYVAGTIKGDENSGIQIEVLGPDGSPVFGPRYVNTDSEGDFSADIPITQFGDYEVSFTDSQGYLGYRTITVLSQTNQPPVGSTTSVQESQRAPSTFGHGGPETTATQTTPLSVLCVIAGILVALVLSRSR